MCIYTHEMFETISRKDIISINMKFDKGTMINESSLDYAISQANKTKSWSRACALLVRAILIDHVFEEGNKRTAAAIIVGYLQDNSLIYEPEKISKAVVTILTKNITNLTTIEKVILNASNR